MDGTGDLFAPFVAAAPLGVDTEVVAYPVDAGDPAALADEVAAQLPADRPFVMVGESFSGPIALAVAARRPPGLAAVVLCATFVQNPVPCFPVFAAPLLRAPLFAVTPPPILEAALLGRYGSPALRQRLRAAIRAVPAAVLAERARACVTTDARADLQACEAPLLVLRATDDRTVPAARTAAIGALRPDAVQRALPGPHLLLQVSAAAAWREITAFVGGAPTAAVTAR